MTAQPSHSEPLPRSGPGDPTWEIATHFPRQGEWTEDDYLRVAHQRGVELVDGILEFLPMPTEYHQLITLFLVQQVQLAAGDQGLALFSGLRVKTQPGRMREPDVVFMFHRNRDRRSNSYWQGADLAMEVVSPDDPERDTVVKRKEYAQTGIPEYWIVDPGDRTVRQLHLPDGEREFNEMGVFDGAARIQSVQLPKLRLTANEIFDRPDAAEQD